MWSFQALLKLSVIISIVFSLTIAAIHAQPLDDTDLRAFLTSSADCVRPCFMGIHPGIMGVSEGVAALRQSPWVKTVTVRSDFRLGEVEAITWDWNGTQPKFIKTQSEAQLVLSRVNEYTPYMVESILISTNLHVGDLYRLFGQPRINTHQGNTRQESIVIAVYDSQAMVVRVVVPCPAAKWRFLEQQAVIEFSSTIQYMTEFNGIHHWC
jgi:hypothetical protein